MSVVEQLHEALKNCLSHEDDTRRAGEATLDSIFEANLAETANALLLIIESSQDDGVRQLCAILFRRHCSSMTQSTLSFWGHCDADQRATLKARLLYLLDNWSEDNYSLKHKVCDCVAAVVKAVGLEISDQLEEQGHDIANFDMPSADEYWPELLQSLWTHAQSGNDNRLETALYIFSCIPGVFGGSLEKYAEAIHGLLSNSISHPNLKVQVSAALALSGLLGRMDTKHARYFADLLPPTIMVVAKALQEDEVSAGEQTLKALVELTETQPKLFKPQIEEIVRLMLSLAENAAMEDGCRRLALEVCIGLCESAGPMMRKVPNFVEAIFPVCIRMIMEVEEDDEWSMQDEPISNEDENSLCGEDALDRLAQTLGGKLVVPVAFEILPALMEGSTWKERYAACIALASIGEGCYKVMRESLGGILEKCLPLLGDQNMRVQYSAINALGQLAVDFAPRSPKEYETSFAGLFHAQVIPAFIMCMQHADEHPRVQAHGAFALINLMDNTRPSDLEPFNRDILECVGHLLQSRFVLVQEAAVGLLATVADSAQEKFVDYYSTFMPYMKQILQHAGEKEHRMLRGKTLEAATLMGVSVGKEMFHADAVELMQIMQQVQLDPDDPQISYIHTSFARICQVLGDDFSEYLGFVLPSLLHSAKLPSGIIELDDDDEIEDLPDGAQAWECLAIDDQRFAIKTSVVEEKRSAIEMLILYCQHLGGKFAPLVEEVLEAALKNLAYYFDEGIRISSSIILSYLLHSYKENEAYGEAKAAELFQRIYPRLISETQREPFLDVLSSKIGGLHMCVSELGEAALSPDFLQQVSAMILKLFEDYEERVKDRLEQRQEDEDHDEEEEENLTEEEESDNEAISELCTLLQIIIHVGKGHTKAFFDGLAPEVFKLVGENVKPSDERCALSVMADVIEAFGPESAEYLPHVGPSLLRNILSEDYELRELAAYDVGLVAANTGGVHAPDICKEMCVQAVEPLLHVIQAGGSRQPPNTSATENCISALVKISRNFGFPPEAEVLPRLIDWLPLTEDDDEAEYIYTYILQLVQSQVPEIMAEESLWKIVRAFAQVVGTNVAPLHEALCRQMAELLQGVMGMAGSTVQSNLMALMQDNEIGTRVQMALESLGSTA
eukprot:m.212049 g.212049  ORF g.212049 m.212049 type:complete len:1129 (-) comp16944_c7_seq1:387-3773(-)